MTEPTARMPMISPDEWNDAVRKMFDGFAVPGRPSIDNNHVLRTFAHHTDLGTPFLIFNKHLLRTSTLPVRLRQIAIMRVAWLKRARYMWSSHLRTSLSVGLVGEDFAPIIQGADSAHWNQQERLIILATEYLLEHSDLDDTLWQALSAFLDRRQILDFLFTVGTYVLLAMVMNTLRIEREPELQALAQQYGAPN